MEKTIEKIKSHPFGDLLKQHLNRRQGLSQNKLAAGIDFDPAVITDMCHGRRLTGPSARHRVLVIIDWLKQQDVLHTEEEATALLEAAGMAKLNACQPNELDIDDLPKIETQTRFSGSSESVGSSLNPHRNQLEARRILGIIAIGVLIIGLIPLARLWIVTSMRSQLAWQEKFNPIEKGWSQITAAWEDVAGPTAILHENNPVADYGKVESEIITVDVDAYPILRIDVVSIDLGASYTVQVLDKRTNIPKDVIKAIISPGEQTVNLAQQMGWRGQQSFTINIWIGGEGKSATFRGVSIERK